MSNESTKVGTPEKPVWQSPRLQELGNIRRFVLNTPTKALGKSGPTEDGNSMSGAEEMF